MEQSKKHILAKKLLYQSLHRGCKETDLVLGRFAEKFLFNMTLQELQDFEIILKQNDSDIYDWLTKKSPLPLHLNSDVMQMLLNFDITKN